MRYRKGNGSMRACIQKVAMDLLHKYMNARLIPRAVNVDCVDCGARKPMMHYDHRDYGEALTVVPVCGRCNRLRGPARITVIDPDTLVEVAA